MEEITLTFKFMELLLLTLYFTMAASHIPVPEPMNCKHSDLVCQWQYFKESWEIYETATELVSKDQEIRCATLKVCMGKDCLSVLKHLDMTEEDRKTTKGILEALETYFKPQKNVVYERYVFFTCDQQATESVDQYITKLKELASSCDFGNLNEEMIRDRLVLGCVNPHVRERMFREKDLTLIKARDMCRSAEITQMQLAKMNVSGQQAQSEIHFAKNKSRKPNYAQETKEGHKMNKNPIYKKKQHSSHSRQNVRDCKYCGGEHKKGSCPAYGKICHKCHKKNHFAKCCQTVHWAQEVISDTESDLVFTVNDTTPAINGYERWIAHVNISYQRNLEIPLKCQIDTGASCNIMGYNDAAKIMRNKQLQGMQPCQDRMSLYDGSIMKARGKVRFTVVYKEQTVEMEFKILNTQLRPLLSGEACEKLGIIKRVNSITSTNKPLQKDEILKDFSDVFTGLGCLPGDLHLQTDPDVKPVQHVPRKFAVAIREPLKNLLYDLEKRGVIVKETEPTDWISSMVVVKKPSGALRICIDPKDLNRALKRAKYPHPIIEDILPKLGKAQIYSVCDAKEAFWQVRLDEHSSRLTCFWTPYGRYRWLRMPFGICTATEEFQRRLHDVLEGLQGVEVIADDILIYGSGDTTEEASTNHDKNLLALLERAREVNLKLNPSKFRLRLPEVRFMGHLLTENGLKPDPQKIEAITCMPKPENAAAVRRYLGFVNYLSKFLPNLSDLAEPLRKLIQENTVFTWMAQHDESWNKINDLIIKEPLLKFYDLSKEVTIQADASEKGLGATLMQQGQPVAYASRTLSVTERNYAQIEKECLAILFACERFDSYIHGRELVNVQSDHKPLESIFKKPISAAPKRLQRMLLRLQKYQLKVYYKKGNEMVIADTLSRAMLPARKKSEISESQIFTVVAENRIRKEIEQVNPTDYLCVSEQRLHQIQSLTKSDETLQTLISIIMVGWPEYRDQVPVSIREYFAYRDELAVHNGIVYRGDRVVIPRAMRAEMLQRIHSSHQGIEASVRRGKDTLFWPGMHSEIKDTVQNCGVCAENASAQVKEPLQPLQISKRPWQMVAMDLCQISKKDYLITVDMYSDFFEVDRMKETNAKAIIQACKANFARHGIPEMVMSDKGPQFANAEFRQFTREWEFVHKTSSPYYSRSNGKAESAVKIAKKLVKKAVQDGRDPWMALLEQRNTPTQGLLSSPVQRLMSRRTRTLIPTSLTQLQPRIEHGVQEKLQAKRDNAKRYYDRGAKVLPNLYEGQPIRVKLPPNSHEYDGKWKLGLCKGQVAPRSYEVELNGKNFRRNRKDIRTTNQSASTEPADDVQPNDPSSNSMMMTNKSDIKQTRSGRIIRPPKRYRDCC